MATGYTEGILNGKINTFKDFALKCVLAFGASIHLRDETGDVKYRSAEPTDYHKKAIQDAKKELNRIENLTDDEIINSHIKTLKADKERCLREIEKIKKDREKLEDILAKAENFVPPTQEHEEFRQFMINQLKQTIEFDCNTDFYDREIAKIDNQLKNINVIEIRESMIDYIKENIEYHTKAYEKEVRNCNKSNKWVDDIIHAIKDQNL